MKLNFNLEDIKYLKLELFNDEKAYALKLALKEKRENDFIAIMPKESACSINIHHEYSLTFVTSDGLYKTRVEIKDVYEDDEYFYVTINNPATLDYQQNREYYRILAEYDCVYNVETDDGIESFNAQTYDISAGGVSIITEENIIPTRETSIVIYLQERILKTHLQFVRCETFGDNYKLSFIFTDLSDSDYEMLEKMCIKKQITNF